MARGQQIVTGWFTVSLSPSSSLFFRQNRSVQNISRGLADTLNMSYDAVRTNVTLQLIRRLQSGIQKKAQVFFNVSLSNGTAGSVYFAMQNVTRMSEVLQNRLPVPFQIEVLSLGPVTVLSAASIQVLTPQDRSSDSRDNSSEPPAWLYAAMVLPSIAVLLLCLLAACTVCHYLVKRQEALDAVEEFNDGEDEYARPSTSGSCGSRESRQSSDEGGVTAFHSLLPTAKSSRVVSFKEQDLAAIPNTVD